MPFGVSRALVIGTFLLSLVPPARALDGAWVSMGPDGGYMASVTYDPVTPNVVYGAASSDILKSVDGGVTWARIQPPGYGYTPEVLVDPVVHTTIYVARAGKMLKSTDAGATWSQYPAGDGYPSSLAIDPINPVNLWLGGLGKIFRSTDGGVTWTAVALPGVTTEQVFDLVVDPVTPSTLYGAASYGAGPGVGIFKSTDGGLSYTRVLASAQSQAMAIDPVNPSNVFAALVGALGVYRSTNAGASWTLSTTGLTSGVPRHGLAVDPTNPQIVYAGGGGSPGKVHKSTDGGVTWTAHSSGLPSPGYVQSVVIDPSNSQTLLGADQSGVVRSTDGGVTWTMERAGIRSSSIRGVTVDPSNADVLYVASQNLGLSKSTDGGATWSDLTANLFLSYVDRVLVDPATPSNVYVQYSFGAGISRSIDGGVTQDVGDDGIYDSVNAVAIAASAPSTLYAATSGGVYKTTDGAVSWNLTGLSGSPVGTTIAVHPGSANGVFVGSGTSVFRSNDGGDSWVSIEVQPSGFGGTITALAIDPTLPSVMYAGISNGFFPGVYQSGDGGTSWSRVASAGATGFAFRPPSTVVGISQGSVLVSRDGGSTWTNELDGLVYPWAVAVGGSTMYVGTNSNGLWQRSLDPCTTDAQCDDRNLCTVDTCNPSDPSADTLGCRHSAVGCTPSDCHGATCQPDTGTCLEFQRPDNTACIDDGTICTKDVCRSGVCMHDPFLATSCKATPSKASSLAIKNLVPAKATLTWKWRKGTTALAELGDPFSAGTSDYTLCGFDHSGPGGTLALLFSIEAPAGGTCGTRPKPCWTSKGTKIRYKDKDRTPDGADTLELVPGGTAAAKMTMVAKGLDLSLAPSPYAPVVDVQLRRDDASTCWESTFQTNVSKNLPGLFRAKSD